ncbi:hypothetical protein DFH27DRAFT_523042 [Peziza echinospora]|nr:hypothetical protein DFH27DRAFT_523042 [Peziza echinospora]
MAVPYQVGELYEGKHENAEQNHEDLDRSSCTRTYVRISLREKPAKNTLKNATYHTSLVFSITHEVLPPPSCACWRSGGVRQSAYPCPQGTSQISGKPLVTRCAITPWPTRNTPPTRAPPPPAWPAANPPNFSAGPTITFTITTTTITTITTITPATTPSRPRLCHVLALVSCHFFPIYEASAHLASGRLARRRPNGQMWMQSSPIPSPQPFCWPTMLLFALPRLHDAPAA